MRGGSGSGGLAQMLLQSNASLHPDMVIHASGLFSMLVGDDGSDALIYDSRICNVRRGVEY